MKYDIQFANQFETDLKLLLINSISTIIVLD
jgi:hypothetical protein